MVQAIWFRRVARGVIGVGSGVDEVVGGLIRQIVVCAAAVPLLAAAAILQTVPAIMLAVLCGVCCYLAFTNNKFGTSRSDMAFFMASVAWCVVFALLVYPLLVIPAILMVWGAMAPKKLWNMPAKTQTAM